MKMDWIVASTCALLLAGCGSPKSVGNLDDGGDGSSSGGDDGGTSAGPGPGTSAGDDGGTSGGPSTSAGDGGGTSDGGSTTGEPTCMSGQDEPCAIDHPLAAGDGAWSLGEQLPGASLFAVPCVVDGIDDVDGSFAITLQCDEGELSERVLTVSGSAVGGLIVVPGSSVVLDYRVETPFWFNAWFTLRTQGDVLIVAGVSGSDLLPGGEADFFAPLELEAHDGPCAPLCAIEGCGVDQRLALGVGFDGDTLEVHDGNSGVLGQLTSMGIVLERATRFVENDPPSCDDIPPAWFQAVFYNGGDG